MGLFDFFKKKHKNIEEQSNNDVVDIPISMTVGTTKVSSNIQVTTSFLEKFSKNRENPNSCESIPNENEIILRCDEITAKHRIYLNEEIYDKIELTSLKGYNCVAIPKDKWDYACKKVEEENCTRNLLATTASQNTDGQELEKRGDILEAIELYEKNVATRYPALHAYQRLMVLYHKQKDYANEKRIIEISIDVFDKDNQERAERCIKQHPNKKEDILRSLSSCTQLRGDDGWVIFNPVDVNKWRKRLEKLTSKM